MIKERKKNAAKRSSASFKQTTVKSDKISAYKYDSKPSTIMSSSASPESSADRELKRMMSKEVFRSDPKAIKRTNSNPRRTR